MGVINKNMWRMKKREKKKGREREDEEEGKKVAYARHIKESKNLIKSFFFF